MHDPEDSRRSIVVASRSFRYVFDAARDVQHPARVTRGPPRRFSTSSWGKQAGSILVFIDILEKSTRDRGKMKKKKKTKK